METQEQVNLTTRQQEILYWASRGKTSWSIAKILGVSEHTVQYHFRNILQIFSVNTRQEAIAIAVRKRVIE